MHLLQAITDPHHRLSYKTIHYFCKHKPNITVLFILLFGLSQVYFQETSWLYSRLVKIFRWLFDTTSQYKYLCQNALNNNCITLLSYFVQLTFIPFFFSRKFVRFRSNIFSTKNTKNFNTLKLCHTDKYFRSVNEHFHIPTKDHFCHKQCLLCHKICDFCQLKNKFNFDPTFNPKIDNTPFDNNHLPTNNPYNPAYDPNNAIQLAKSPTCPSDCPTQCNTQPILKPRYGKYKYIPVEYEILGYSWQLGYLPDKALQAKVIKDFYAPILKRSFRCALDTGASISFVSPAMFRELAREYPQYVRQLKSKKVVLTGGKTKFIVSQYFLLQLENLSSQKVNMRLYSAPGLGQVKRFDILISLSHMLSLGFDLVPQIDIVIKNFRSAVQALNHEELEQLDLHRALRRAKHLYPNKDCSEISYEYVQSAVDHVKDKVARSILFEEICNFPKVLSLRDKYNISFIPGIECHAEFRDDATWRTIRPYPMTSENVAMVMDYFRMLVAYGHLEPALDMSEYAAPVLVVDKKIPINAPSDYVPEKRIVFDFNLFNRNLKKYIEVIPDILRIVNRHTRKRFKITADIRQAYFHFLVSKYLQKYLRVMDPLGNIYICKTMPQAITIAPTLFNIVINHGLPDDFDSYFDDLIAGCDNYTEFRSLVRKLFEYCYKWNITLNIHKSQWYEEEVHMLGYNVGYEQLAPGITTVNNVLSLDISPTTTKQQVMAMIGLVGYSRRFIPNLSKFLAPLSSLLKKRKIIRYKPGAKPIGFDLINHLPIYDKKDFEVVGERVLKKNENIFDEDFRHNLYLENINELHHVDRRCREALLSIKKILENSPILAPPNYNKQFIIYTDASDESLGAVICQIDDDNRLRPIEYMSATLPPT